MTGNEARTGREKLIVIEEILRRMEQKQDEDRETLAALAGRVGKLERMWAYILGVGGGVGATAGVYFKGLLSK